MSPSRSKFYKFGAAIAVILVALVYLAWTGVQEGKSYYVTIKELHSGGDVNYTRHLRLYGIVQPGSIHQVGTNAEFVLVDGGETQQVSYKGSEPPPDTFKDNAQALAIGRFGHDGVFHATEVQAKCASKYAPQQGAEAAQPSKGY